MARIAICVAVMVKRSIAPIGSVGVTITAFAGPMSVWARMAGGAIIVACVVKGHVRPVRGIVAIGTVTVIMRCGRRMASDTIATGAAVIELDGLPFICDMANGALAWIMVCTSGMASGTIFQGGVVDVDLPPVTGFMAGGALLGVMVSGGIGRMTVETIFEIGMYHHHVFPLIGIVAA